MDRNIHNSGGVTISSMQYDFMWITKSKGIRDEMFDSKGGRKSYISHLKDKNIEYAIWNPVFGRGILFGVYAKDERLVFIIGNRIFAPQNVYYNEGRSFTSKLFTRNIIEVSAGDVKSTGRLEYHASIIFEGQLGDVYELGIAWNGITMLNIGFEDIVDLGQVKIEV